MDKATDSLVNGYLPEWLEDMISEALPSLNNDEYERTEYRDPAHPERPAGIHVRLGLADIVVNAIGEQESGAYAWQATVHTHDGAEDAETCYRTNVQRNQQRLRERAQDPERAALRDQARDMGMPEELVDRVVPMSGEGMLDQVKRELDQRVQTREGLDRLIPTWGLSAGDDGYLPDAPVSGGPVGFYL